MWKSKVQQIQFNLIKLQNHPFNDEFICIDNKRDLSESELLNGFENVIHDNERVILPTESKTENKRNCDQIAVQSDRI